MDQIIKLVDENGIEKEFRYLFAVTRTQTDVPYAFFMETNATRPEVVVYKFDEEGNLKDLETQEEWIFAQKAFNAQMAKMQGGCDGCHGGCHGDDTCGCGDNCGCEGDCQ